ncbi:MAG: MlaD family protein [Paracoccaceae bacterium]
MSDAKDAGPLDPELDTGGRRRISLIWAFPVVAVLVTLALLWRDYAGRGPVIEISFPTAAGLVPGDTGLKFRNVEVGRVEDLNFSADLSRVVAVVRVDPEIARYLDEDAEFWVVRPEVNAQGISGLETVISGAYIEGSWNAEEGVARRKFTARDDPPLISRDAAGIQVRLKAADGGSLTIGAPVFYRRVEVGRVETKRLTSDGQAVVFDVFINAPNDLRLTEETRFWIVPGVDMSFGAEGARFSIGSLSALWKGGVSFEEFSGGAANKVESGHQYDLYASPSDARARVQEVDPGEQLSLDVYFGGSVRGLSTGASV